VNRRIRLALASAALVVIPAGAAQAQPPTAVDNPGQFTCDNGRTFTVAVSVSGPTARAWIDGQGVVGRAFTYDQEATVTFEDGSTQAIEQHSGPIREPRPYRSIPVSEAMLRGTVACASTEGFSDVFTLTAADGQWLGLEGHVGETVQLDGTFRLGVYLNADQLAHRG
jgi:hypothetical protein